MIQKAIEKIEEEMKSGGAMEKTLGEYIKSELLTSDANALKVLAPNTDLETFTERLQTVASSIKSHASAKKAWDADKMGKHIIAVINGIKDEEVADESFAEIGNLCGKVSANNNCVCLTSEIIVPLLHIYYGRPLEQSPKKESAPKRRFNAVSLD